MVFNMRVQRYQYSGRLHTILGTLLFALIWLQPIFGYIHHRLFVQKGQKTLIGHLHVWYGRILLVLAVVNGGLGLHLAHNTQVGKIVYGLVAGLIGVLYASSIVCTRLSKQDAPTLEVHLSRGIGSNITD